MTYIHHSKKVAGNSTRIDNGPLHDPRLSLRAKGLLAYAMTLPREQRLSIKDIMTVCTDGKKRVQGALRELSKAGYAKLVRVYGAAVFGTRIVKLPDDGTRKDLKGFMSVWNCDER